VEGGVFSVRVRYSFSGGSSVAWEHQLNAVPVRSLARIVREGVSRFRLPTPRADVRCLVRSGIRRSLKEAA
jgi:hypothetical protein